MVGGGVYIRWGLRGLMKTPNEFCEKKNNVLNTKTKDD